MSQMFPTPWVVSGLKAGLSQAAALRAFRAGGGRIRDAVWRQIWYESKAALDRRADAITSHLDSLPDAGEVQTFTTATASGYLQQVELTVRYKGTNEVEVIPYSSKGGMLRSKQSVIDEALSVYQAAIDDGRYDDQIILGAVYVGTYNMVPGGAA